MAKYYGVVNGVTGVGKALSKTGSVEITDKNPEPTQRRGGTFSNVYISEKIKNAVEKRVKNEDGFNNGFFGFKEVPDKSATGDTQYEIYAKYPEMGREPQIETENGLQEGKAFSLRKNINIFNKSFAKSFLDEDGNVDLKKGLYINKIFSDAASEDMMHRNSEPSELLKTVDKYLDSPKDNDDYNTFLKNCVYYNSDNEKTVISPNYFVIWQSSLNGAYCAKLFLDDIEGRDASQLTDAEKAFKKECENTLENFKKDVTEIANCDPETENRMLILSECSGSCEINENLSYWKNNFDNPGSEYTPEDNKTHYHLPMDRFRTKFIDDYKNTKKAYEKFIKENPENTGISFIEGQREHYKKELNKYITNLIDYNIIQKDRAKDGNYVDANDYEIPDEAFNEANRKKRWPFHAAFIGTNINVDGKDLNITIEGVAPETHSIASHAGTSFSGSNIGFYNADKDDDIEFNSEGKCNVEKDFNSFYLSDGIDSTNELLGFNYEERVDLLKKYYRSGSIADKEKKNFFNEVKDAETEMNNKIDSLSKLKDNKTAELKRLQDEHKKDLAEYNKKLDAERKKIQKSLAPQFKNKEQEIIARTIPQEYIKKYKLKSLSDMAELGTDKGRGKKLTPAEKEGFKALAEDLISEFETYKQQELKKAFDENLPNIREAISNKGKKQNLLDAHDNEVKLQKDLEAIATSIEELNKQKKYVFEKVIAGENDRGTEKIYTEEMVGNTEEKNNITEKVDDTEKVNDTKMVDDAGKVKKVSLIELTSKNSGKNNTNKQSNLTKFVESNDLDKNQKENKKSNGM